LRNDKIMQMRTNTPRTPLLNLLRQLTAEQRETLADNAGTKVSYLYSLASCQRGEGQSCSAPLALKIEEATIRMHHATDGETPIVTIRDLATMCEVRA
jgi:hypothetical protein